jgi:hypothetical protein
MGSRLHSEPNLYAWNRYDLCWIPWFISETVSCVLSEENRVLPCPQLRVCVRSSQPDNAFPEPEFPVLNSSGGIPGGSGKLS